MQRPLLSVSYTHLVLARHHIVAGAYLYAAAAVLVNFTHLRFIIHDLAAAHKVRGGHGGADIVVLVLHQRHGGGTQLRQIEGADVAGHAHRNAQRVVGQNGGEGDRQQGGLGLSLIHISRCADPAIADDLKYVLATANTLAAGRYQVAYCPSLVRGQGYYTGMVFEVTCPQFSGAVAGGGRYDNMVGKFLGVQVPAVGFSIGFERVCGILLEQGYQIPGAKQKIALLYGKDTDFPAVLRKAAALREQYNVTVLPQGKKLGKQLGQLEAAGFAGAAFMDKDEVKIFAQQ